MKAVSKHIISLIVLVILSNGVFAGQMCSRMMDMDSSKSLVALSEPSCHGGDIISEEPGNERQNCCYGDCMDCVTGFQYLQSPQLFIVSIYSSAVTAAPSTHMLPQHSSNLFRPPILI